MDTSIGQSRISVREEMLKFPKQFSFEMAIYVFGYNSKISYGTEALISDSPVKTISMVSYKLRATEIEKINETDRITIFTNKLALAGLNAPLPTPYSELIIQRFHERDYAISAFLNIFNSKLLGVAYRISQRRHIALQRKGNRPLLKCVSNFFGASNTPQKMTRLSYLFWSRNRTLEGLRIILEEYFKFKVKIDPLSELWSNHHDIKLLGKNRLSENAYLGRQANIKSFCIKIHITHDNPDVIYSLLSNDTLLNDVKLLITKYLGSLITCKLEIIPQVATALKFYSQLGHNTWLQGNPTDARRINL